MNLVVKGKHFDIGDALRNHIAESLNGAVKKYFTNSVDATVVLTRDAHHFTADIQVHVGRGILLQSNAKADEPYPAFDLASEKLAKRLGRYKSRLRDHHRQDGAEAQIVKKYILQPEAEDAAEETVANPTVVAEMTTAIDSLTVSEAVMRMDLAELPALMFRNRAHGGLNMVYRRADGHIGWVDPQAA